MKKSFLAAMAILLAVTTAASIGCGKGAKQQTDAALSTQTVERTGDYLVKQTLSPDPVELNGDLRPDGRDTYVVRSEDGFYEYGFTCFIANSNSEYTVDFDTDGGAVEWKVYLLDDKFPDANRYLPQEYEPALTQSGKLKVTKGQYVYVQCSVSSYSEEKPYEGATVTFTGAGLPKD